MSGELRARLAEVLAGREVGHSVVGYGSALEMAAALLSVVHELIAEALEAAAEDLPERAMVSDHDRRNGATRPDARSWLRDRAAEIREQP